MGICYCLVYTGRENYIEMKDECSICLENVNDFNNFEKWFFTLGDYDVF